MEKENVCKRCGYKWKQRNPEADAPKSCPRCKSYAWNDLKE